MYYPYKFTYPYEKTKIFSKFTIFAPVKFKTKWQAKSEILSSGRTAD
jgi:hypothetical protein